MKKRRLPLACFCFSLLLSSLAYADRVTRYEDVLEEAIQALAKDDSAAALSLLQRYQQYYAGHNHFELLLAVAQLELKQFSPAQQTFRVLAKRSANGDGKVRPEVERTYAALWQARQNTNVVLPKPASHFAAMDKRRRLNINFNRRVLGLPFIGDVTQWRDFGEYMSSGDFAANQAQQQFVPRPKPSAINLPRSSSNTAADSAVDLSALLQTAQQQLAAAQPRAAYATLQPYELEGAGDPEFDYLLGTAAVDAGKPDEAIFVLLRALAVQPNHAGARLELGRAYYANGDHAAAKSAFETVLQQSPPPQAKQLSERYLAVIEDYLKSQLRNVTPFVEARVGYDSNVNGATDDEQPFDGIAGISPLISGITLSKSSLETDAAFMSISAGTGYSQQLKPRYFLRAGAQLDAQTNDDATFVNTQALRAYAQYEYRQGRQLLGAAVDAVHSYVGGDFNANTLGLSLLGGQPVGDNWALNGQLRGAVKRFTQSQDVKDSSDYTLSLSASRYWAGHHRVSSNFGVIAQKVDARTDVNSKRVLGGQASVQFVAFQSVLFAFSAVALNADYDAAIVGTDKRSDNSYLLGIGVTKYSARDPNLKWLFNLDGRRTLSSLDLYDSKGLKASVGVRYDFR